MRRSILLGVALLLGACSAPIGATGDQTSQPPVAPAPSSSKGETTPGSTASLPVDPNLTAVSRSNPGAEAEQVLALCGVKPDDPRIVGMARLPTAADIPRYAPVVGPELARDYKVVWLVQLQGNFTPPTRAGSPRTYPDPTCANYDGESIFYGTHGSKEQDKFRPAPEPAEAPSAALPPMTP